MMETVSTIQIRPCTGYTELDACVSLQEQVWGYEERDIIPRRLFVVAQRIGGQVFGAFEADPMNGSGKMVGFAMGLPAWATHHPGDCPLYLHSHMLAVSEQWRNQGIGRRLKLAQREEALLRGIKRMEWTFDPLESKNAYLNLHRLGAIVRSYSPDFYGSTSSSLQTGLQTDRMHAEWLLDSERVRRVVEDLPIARPKTVQRIVVPAALPAWRRTSEGCVRAAAVQACNRELLLEAFRNGRVVVGFDLDEEGNGVYNLAEPTTDAW